MADTDPDRGAFVASGQRAAPHSPPSKASELAQSLEICGRQFHRSVATDKEFCARMEKSEARASELAAEVARLRGLLVLARNELASAPHSLGYAYTALPRIDAALAITASEVDHG